MLLYELMCRLNSPEIDLYMFLNYRCRDCCHYSVEDNLVDILRGDHLKIYFHRVGWLVGWLFLGLTTL